MSPPFRLVGVAGEFRVVEPPTIGMRRYGVPEGGPFDRESAALARALVAGDPQAMLHEVVGLATLEFDRACTVSVVGAPIAVALDAEERPANAAWHVPVGSRVTLRAARSATRVYVGWSEARLPERRLGSPPHSLRPGPIRILPGPDAVEMPLDGWTVSTTSNRLGLRLGGPGRPHSIELPSRPTAVGTVQVTPSGMPIILGPDGPTIGGYPQAAVVIDADRDRLAQWVAGQSLDFQWVSPEAAADLRREYRQALRTRLAQLAIAGDASF
ncbi:MAG: hypothetical protein ACO1SV_20585 [Fimbriimonas sp.]